jgi:hypothetical protein
MIIAKRHAESQKAPLQKGTKNAARPPSAHVQQTAKPSLSEPKRETEETRAGLTDTVE